jgi:DNA-binding MarR family transcriptional regulator
MKSSDTTELIETMFKVAHHLKDKMSFKSNLKHLSILQIRALHYINCSGKKVSMTDIADHFSIELPSATSLINKLCDQKLVERVADKNDRRLVLIMLTGSGKKLLEKAMVQRKENIEELLLYLSAKQKSDLLSIFKTLNNGITKSQQNH